MGSHNLEPSTLGYDFAKEFLFPAKSTAEIYSPLQRDFATMLNIEFRKHVVFHSGRSIGLFDYKAYFTHFFLGLFFASVEIAGKKAGIEQPHWYFDKNSYRLKIFFTLPNGEKGAKKKLVLKCIDLLSPNAIKSQTWSENDLKNIVVELHNAKENLDDYTAVESHWYQATVENVAGPNLKDVTCPFVFFTLSVEDTNLLDREFIKRSVKNRRKVPKNFLEMDVAVNYAGESLSSFSTKDFFVSNIEDHAKSSLGKFLPRLVRLFKDNVEFKVGSRELNSMRSISQCSFAHGVLLTLQKKASFTLRVEQTSLENPNYVIRICRQSLRDSWPKILDSVPIQLEFIKNAEKVSKKQRETVLLDQITADRQIKADRVFANTLSSELIVVYMNFNANKVNYISERFWIAKPVTNVFEVIQDTVATSIVNMVQNDVEGPNLKDLQKYIEREFAYIKEINVPVYKKERIKYLSRYLTGFLASNRLSEKGYIYDISLKNPSELEKDRMTSFLLKSQYDNLDIVFNIYEQEELKSDDFKYFMRSSTTRKYPRTSNLVIMTFVVDFFSSFYGQSQKRPEYKSHIFHASTISLKPLDDNNVIESDFFVRRLKHLDLPVAMLAFEGDPKGQHNRQTKNAIKDFLDLQAEKHNINNKYEFEALIHGLMHHVRNVKNLVDMRKGVFQIGFISDAKNSENAPDKKKLFLINFGFGLTDPTIEALDEMRDLLENEQLIKGQDRVQAILNVAMVKNYEGSDEKPRTMILENQFLSILGKCARRPSPLVANRKKRDALCSSREVQSIFETKEKSEIYKDSSDKKLKVELSQKSQKYLENLNRFGAGIMYGLMAKNLVADILRGNIAGVAVNSGFLISNMLSDTLANKLLTKSAALIASEKILLGTILKAGAPFLRRLPSFAFVGFDLYNSIEAYKNNQSEALVNIGVDSAYIAIDLAETAIEVTEAFGLIEGVAAVTGPIGWTAGAVLLLGADIYHSFKKVEQIDSTIHLTKMERFTEKFRAFFGMDPESHVQSLINEKRLLSDTINEMVSFLKQHPTIRRYIFPVALDKYQNSCLINLQNTFEFQLARSMPFDASNSKYTYFCIPRIVDDSNPTDQFVKAHICKNAIGLEDPSEIKTSNLTYIQLGTGNDTILGAEDDPNIFDITGPGYKLISGGKNDDLFIIRNGKSSGVYNGHEGRNLLDLSNLNSPNKVYLGKHMMKHDNETLAHLPGINGIIGRQNQPELISCWCDVTHVELHGGGNSFGTMDKIMIPLDNDCFYNLTTRLDGGDTQLFNNARNGHFTYLLTMLNGSFHINLASSSMVKGQNLVHKFIFDYTVLDFKSISMRTFVKNNLSHIFLSYSPERFILVELPLVPENLDFCSMLFKDGSKLHVTKTGHGVITINTIAQIDQVIDLYAPLVANSSISLVIHSMSENKTATITRDLRNLDSQNHERYDVDIHYNNPEWDHHFDQTSSFVHESIFMIKAKEEQTINRSTVLTMKNVTISLQSTRKQKIIVDLNQLETQVKLHASPYKLVVKPLISHKSVILMLLLQNNPTARTFGFVTLLNAMKYKLSGNIVIQKSCPMILTYHNHFHQAFLRPVPLHFDETKNLILISPQDKLDYGMKITFNTSLYHSRFFHFNHTDLVLTNLFSTKHADMENPFTLVIKDFYVNDMMQSLNLKFSNRAILLDRISGRIQNVKSFEYLIKRLYFADF